MTTTDNGQGVAQLTEFLKLVVQPDGVVEVRALHVETGYRPCTMSGFFDYGHVGQAAEAALKLNGKGVYFTLNPIKPELLARRCNRVSKAETGDLAGDQHVLRRRWLLIDADPVRVSGISSTDEEKAASLALALEIREHLRGLGFPEPILSDSGNGYHLLYRIDLPADDGKLVERFLKALAAKFNTPAVTVDTSVFNPARICKLPGTWNRKGDDTPDRPHRQSKVLEIPSNLVIVPEELLRLVADEVKDAGTSKTTSAPSNGDGKHQGNGKANGYSGGKVVVDHYLTEHGVSYTRKPGKDNLGRTVWVLDQCPLNPDHGRDSCVMQADDGQLSARCFHNGCSGRGWQDFKAAIGPLRSAHYDGGGPVSRPSNNTQSHGRLSNYFLQEVEEGEPIKIGRSIGWLFDEVMRLTAGWPKRIDNLLFVCAGYDPLFLQTPDALFSWLQGQLGGDINQVDWCGRGSDKVSEAKLFQFMTQRAENYLAVAGYPHHPPMPGHYYLHPPLQGGDGAALRWLLGRFNPATDCDRDLILAYLAQQVWGGAPGQRPAWLFTGDDGDKANGRGIGKTALTQVGGELFGGSIATSPNETAQSLTTRLLSPAAMSCRQVVVDNIKTHRLSSADLEAMITTNMISGHRLFCGEGRRPNTLTFALTLNGASLSKDLAQRCIPLKLARPPHDPVWEPETFGFITAHRWAIIGDLVAVLKNRGRDIGRYSRWATWERDVLCRVDEPAECAKTIAERQAEIDDDDCERAHMEAAFKTAITNKGWDSERSAIWFTAAQAAEIVKGEVGERWRTAKCSSYLRSLNINNLSKSDRGGSRGWTWLGDKADPNATSMPF